MRTKCDVKIRKPSKFKNYWEEVPCQLNAKFEVKYKLSETSHIIIKNLCTTHKNKLLKEIDSDDFAVLDGCARLAEY